MRGDVLAVVPRTIDVGLGAPGERRVLDVELRNLTAHRATVVGGTSECGCQAARSLPTAIPPKGVQSIEVSLVFPSDPSPFGRTVRLLYVVDGKEQLYEMRFWITGRTRTPFAGADE
jgi:hypothetical protein